MLTAAWQHKKAEMMKIEELRIGSKLESKLLGLEITVTGISEKQIKTQAGKWCEINLFCPIKLTEECLLSLGCKKLQVSGYVISGATYWQHGITVFYECDGEFRLPIGEKINDQAGRTVKCFNSVHEFQMLFPEA